MIDNELMRNLQWLNLMYHPNIFLEGLRRTTKTSISTIGSPAVIRTGRLPNTNQKIYRLWNLPVTSLLNHLLGVR
jgi:hypothetical protein